MRTHVFLFGTLLCCAISWALSAPAHALNGAATAASLPRTTASSTNFNGNDQKDKLKSGYKIAGPAVNALPDTFNAVIQGEIPSTQTDKVTNPIWTTVLWSAIAAILAALAAAHVSRETKISEFRQIWINDLRIDISNYIGATGEWRSRLYEISQLFDQNTKSSRTRAEIDPLKKEASILLLRIKMRFNPRSNKFKTEDDVFLELLDQLLDESRWSKVSSSAQWDAVAASAVEASREILKREWEVTKRIVFAKSRAAAKKTATPAPGTP